MSRALVMILWLASDLAPAPPPARPAVAELVAKLDALHARRDDRAALAEAHRVADAALAAAPSDAGVLWRVARERFAESDVLAASDERRGRLGKEAYDLAARAAAIAPNDVAAFYWEALGVGRYAEGMGVLRALSNGIQDKFLHPLERATALNVRYENGNIPVVWAAYYLALPWPKRDRDKAAQQLRLALQINPANLRARLYQARIANDEDHPEEAQALLSYIARAPIPRYDAPEERKVKREAAQMAAQASAR